MIVRQKWNPDDDAYLIEARSDGLSNAAIGRPHVPINSRLHTQQIPPIKERPEPEPPLPPKVHPSAHRSCMCCGKTFASAGPHNRGCDKVQGEIRRS